MAPLRPGQVTERTVLPGWVVRERLYPVGAPTFVCEQLLADAVCAIGDATDGLDSEGPNAGLYETFCYGLDRPAWRARAADDLSACVIVIFRVLDCCGYDSPQTDTPYEPRMGRAVIEFGQLGREVNAWLKSVDREAAWIDMTKPGAPMPTGPCVALFGDNGAEGAEHGVVFFDGTMRGGFEGGQASIHGRGYRISKAIYEYESRGPGQIWGRRVSPNPNRWRRLRSVIDLNALPFTGPTCLPASVP